MAAISGKGGTVYIGSVSVASVSGWSLDVDNNLLEISSFTTAAPSWRSYTPGLNNGTGNITAFWDLNGSTAQADMQGNILTPASATLVLEVDQATGGKYSMTAFLSRQSVNVDIDGVAGIGWDIQTSGSVTYSTST